VRRLTLRTCELIIYFAVALFFAWSIAIIAQAQPAPETEDAASDAPADPPELTERPLTVVQAGDPAPFAGLLLTDLRFAELKQAELTVNNAKFRALQEQKTREDLQVVLDACLQVEREGDPWYATFWAGAAVGIGVAILVGWLGVEAEWW